MEMQKSRVYVLADEDRRIIQIEGEYSLYNIQNMAEWTLIEEGPPCDRLNHAQNMYLDGGLCTSDFIPRYKLIDGKPVVRTDEEIAADRAALPKPPPSPQEQLQEENRKLRAQVGMLQEQQRFLEDCLLEMADEVYA